MKRKVTAQELKHAGWIFGFALIMLVCSGLFCMSSAVEAPSEGGVTLYWLVSARHYTFLPLTVILATGLLILVIMAIVGTRRKMVTALLPWVSLFVCLGIGIPVLSSYDPLDSIKLDGYTYHVGYRSTFEPGHRIDGKYILCKCDSLGFSCNCQSFYAFQGYPAVTQFVIDPQGNELKVQIGDLVLYNVTLQCFHGEHEPHCADK